MVHSIFAGVPRDSITWEEVVKLAEGEIIEKELPNQFFLISRCLKLALNIKQLRLVENHLKN